MNGSPNLDARDRVTGMVGMLKDITQRALAEQVLRNSQASLARSQQMAHLDSWELELDSGEMTCSDEVFHIYGVGDPQAPLSLQAFLQSVHPEDRALVRGHLNQVPLMEAP